MTVTLRPHQAKAVDEMHNGCVLKGGVGSGKTITSLVYFYTKVCKGVVGDLGSMREPRDLYVITTARKRDSMDWQSDAAKLGIGRERDASVEGLVMTVDSWNNINKYKDVKNAFFIFDEQRAVGSGAWSQTLIKIAKANQWILLSATPGDTWLDYIPVFVANGFYKNRTEFKREHVIYSYYGKFPKVERYVGLNKLTRCKNAVLVHMPYEKHTVRHEHIVDVDYDRDLMKRVVKDRWHVYENRPLKDVAELFTVMRKVANSDVSRLDSVRGLMEKHPRVIVFYNFDYELEILRSLDRSKSSGTSMQICPCIPETTCDCKEREGNLGGSTVATTEKKAGSTLVWTEQPGTTPTTVSDVRIAEWNGHKHEEIPDSERWIYLVQYVAGAEAWNCTETNAMVFWSQTYSYKIHEQCKGRIDRLDTPYTDLHYYHFVSKSPIDLAIRKALREKRSFNESDFVSK